ncbi:hypothetical protein JXA63_02220 [Candidatus Woesebacteria bacterium]|nr:hypothetical protein [Candidatus Woesebacteria bacterium]
MTSLTKVSIVSRKVVRYGIYLLIFGVILRFVILFGKDIYYKLNPVKPLPPEVSYGQLEKIPFPIKESPVKLTYELILPDGELPNFPVQVYIYKMPKVHTNIQVLDSARNKASSLGFDPNGTELVESVYVFEHQEEPSRLTMNIVSGIFSISYDVRANLSILGRFPPSSDEAINTLSSLLGRANSFPEDLTGPVKHRYLKIEETGFKDAISQSDADVIKVNFYRKDYGEEIPSMTPNAVESNVWFYLGGSDRRQNPPIVGGEYHYYPINENEKATYPIKTAQKAWEELQNGEGYIANLGNNDSNIIIRRVYLGYYDAGQYTPYFQPIVVFEGDNDFYAYVPAVEKQFYGNDRESSE